MIVYICDTEASVKVFQRRDRHAPEKIERLKCVSMKRSELIAAVRRAAERLGYMFYTGKEAAIAAKAVEMPAVWLCPPVLKAAKGRAECRDTYGIRIRFLMLPPCAGAQDVGAATAILEADSRSLIEEVARLPCVRKVAGVKIAPDGKPATPRGETGATAEFEAEMFYFKDK